MKRRRVGAVAALVIVLLAASVAGAYIEDSLDDVPEPEVGTASPLERGGQHVHVQVRAARLVEGLPHVPALLYPGPRFLVSGQPHPR
jgi:hypothetical protein